MNDESVSAIPPAVVHPTTRLVVVESIYHQAHNNQPTGSGTQFTRWVKSDEPMYAPERIIRVGVEWKTLDIGYIKAPGMLVIRNMVKKPFHPVVETLDSKASVLEISLVPQKVIKEELEGVGMWATQKMIVTDARYPDIVILPGESARFTPFDVKNISIRCREGDGQYMVIACEE